MLFALGIASLALALVLVLMSVARMVAFALDVERRTPRELELDD